MRFHGISLFSCFFLLFSTTGNTSIVDNGIMIPKTLSVSSQAKEVQAGFIKTSEMDEIQFTDDFEDQDISDWNEATQDYTSSVTSFAASNTSYALELTGGSNENYNGLYQMISSVRPEYVSTWIASSNSAVSDGYFVLSGNNSLEQRIVFLYFGDSGEIKLYQDASYSCGPYEENTYYHIEIILDWDNELIDVYIDGLLKQSKLPFRDPGTSNLDRVNLYNYQNSTAFWDEIYIQDTLANCDNFDREDTTVFTEWTEQEGDWSIDRARLSPERNATDRQYITFNNSEAVNGTASGCFQFGSGTDIRSAGLVARYTEYNSGLVIKLQNQSSSNYWSTLNVVENNSSIFSVSGNFGTDTNMEATYSGTDLTVKLDIDRNGTWDYTYFITVNTVVSGLSGCTGYGSVVDMFIDNWCFNQSSIAQNPPGYGGPDNFGHVWTNFQPFDWIDTSSGTDTGVSGDDAVGGPFDIGFDFNWYGNSYSQFYVSTNGIVGFFPLDGDRHYCDNFGNEPQDNLITCGSDRAVYTAEGGLIRYETTGYSPDRQCVIEFTNMRYSYSNDSEFFDMQVVLKENGSIGEETIIAFQNTESCSNKTALIGCESYSGNDYLLLNNECPNAFYEGLAMTVSYNEMLPGMPVDLTGWTPYSSSSIQINGSTKYGFDDYNESVLIHCCESSHSKEDVFYFTPPEDLSIQIDLINSMFDTTLSIFAPDIYGEEFCIYNDDYAGAPGHLSGFDCLTFSAGTTYTLLISGWANSNGNYVLNFDECEDIRPTATPIATFTPTPTPTPTFTPTSTPTALPTLNCVNHGDVDFSGSLTAGDAQSTFFIVLGVVTPTSEQQCAADCNGDGSVTAGDAQLIFLSVLGSGNCADPI